MTFLASLMFAETLVLGAGAAPQGDGPVEVVVEAQGAQKAQAPEKKAKKHAHKDKKHAAKDKGASTNAVPRTASAALPKQRKGDAPVPLCLSVTPERLTEPRSASPKTARQVTVRFFPYREASSSDSPSTAPPLLRRCWMRSSRSAITTPPSAR